jgi:hypothetical protein
MDLPGWLRQFYDHLPLDDELNRVVTDLVVVRKKEPAKPSAGKWSGLA